MSLFRKEKFMSVNIDKDSKETVENNVVYNMKYVD